MVMDESPPSLKKTSWLSGLFSHWHPLGKWGSTSMATTLVSTATSTTTSKNQMLGPRSSSSSTSISSTATPTITIQLQPPPSPLLSNERRPSQQTIGSVFSDDQFSSSSCHGRTSEERSRLGEIWSKARQRHPHYPRFHWPHRRRHAVPISIYSTPPYEERLANSYQDTHHRPASLLPSTSSPPASMMLKRHSITSLISNNDPYFNSRPHSAPESPRLLFLKDALEPIEPCELDAEDRWTLTHDLVKLALNGSMACPIEENDGTERQVLQIGCGDGSWCVDMATSHPKWTVIGMDETNLDETSLLFKPKNMRLIKCDMIHALQQMPDHVFDLVDLRGLVLAYGLDPYRQLLEEAWRVLKIGGYIELIEMDMRMYHSQPSALTRTVQTLNSEVIHRMESRSLDPRLARRLPDLLDPIILPNSLVTGYTSLPIGVWGGRLGVIFREDVHRLLESVQLEHDDLEHCLDLMDGEMEAARSFMNLHHCYAQKIAL